jgi:hypothetical protein
MTLIVDYIMTNRFAKHPGHRGVTDYRLFRVGREIRASACCGAYRQIKRDEKFDK